MKKCIVLLITLGMLLVLAGCEKTQTVEWYKTHEAERNAVLKKCKDNPGELQFTPNCQNAYQAAASVAPIRLYQPKPVTFDDVKKK